jgi:putative Mg2+ transporter-C (MgtC) family protein
MLRVDAGVGLGVLVGVERQCRARHGRDADERARATFFVLLSAHGVGGMADAEPARVAVRICPGSGSSAPA